MSDGKGGWPARAVDIPLERYRTLEEVAEQHGLSPKYLRQFIRQHQIPVLATPRFIRFDRIALAALEEALSPQAPPSRLPTIPVPPAVKPASLRFDPDEGFVYFVQVDNNGPIKIGTALDIKQRLKGLQTAHFTALRLVGYRQGGRREEQRLLVEFQAMRLTGEWHRPDETLIAFIEANARA